MQWERKQKKENDMGYIEATKRDMRIEKELIAAYSERIDELPEGHLASKTICGHTYYYLVKRIFCYSRIF